MTLLEALNAAEREYESRGFGKALKQARAQEHCGVPLTSKQSFRLRARMRHYPHAAYLARLSVDKVSGMSKMQASRWIDVMEEYHFEKRFNSRG